VSVETPFKSLQWPNGLTTQTFLDQYWQKKPLLIPSAIPNFSTPVSPDELAGMSLEDGTTPRIITQNSNGQYQLEHGPFDADRYESIGDKDWSLMITDCEKHWPELLQWIEPFRFLPRWRMDDLMISFAPDKASVGAHIDEYDVFLLQASGTRRWHIDASENPDTALVEGSDLRILKNFAPTDTWDLQPGDVLYLPPGVPHHGIAVGNDCTTWSIGFRAPSNLDVLDVFSESLLDNLALVRLTDPNLSADNGAEIKPEALAKLRTLWETATALDDEQLIHLSGFLLTRGGVNFDEETRDEFDWYGKTLQWHSFSQVAYVLHADSAELFVNGEVYNCSEHFVKTLADSVEPFSVPEQLTKTDEQTLINLLKTQALVIC